MIHNLGLSGGQEKTTFELLKVLSVRGYLIDLYAYNLNSWPKDLVLNWHKVPGGWLPTNLLKNIWFAIYTYFALNQYRFPIVSAGFCSFRADMRVIHFVHLAFYKLVSKKLASLPNVRTPIHWLYQKLFSIYEEFIEIVLFPTTKKSIAVSSEVKKQILNYFPNVINVSVIHHAFEKIEPKKKNNNPKKILFVGALERKGIKKALEVLSLCQENEWVFDVVGDGNIEKWKAVANKLSISNRVNFHGPMPANDYFKQADIFLFPSLYEPFGLVITEALSQSCLVLASNECGALELWSERPEWLNISAHEHNLKWAFALQKLLSDEVAIDEVRASMEKILPLTWEKIADKYELEIKELSRE